jgi:hypothetical protein
LEFYKAHVYLDRTTLQDNGFGPVFENTALAHKHLRTVLGADQYTRFLQNMTMADDLVSQGIRDKIVPPAASDPSYVHATSKQDILKQIPRGDTHIREFFDDPGDLFKHLPAWPTAFSSALSDSLTMFYTTAVGALECLRFDEISSLVYRISTDPRTQTVAVVAVSVATASVILYPPQMVTVGQLSRVAFGSSAILVRAVGGVRSATNFLVVNSLHGVALLRQSIGGRLSMVAATVVMAGNVGVGVVGDGVRYLFQKTMNTGLMLVGSLVAVAGTGLVVYNSIQTTKRRRGN